MYKSTYTEEYLKGWEIPVLDKGGVRLVDWYGSDLRICETARISYKSPSKGDEKDKRLLFYLYKNRHTSPFEQCAITFNIKLPLFVQGQMVRHRTQKLNQVSARYTEMKEEFYIPSEWRRQDVKNKQGSVEGESFDPYLANYNWDVGSMSATEALEHVCRHAYHAYESMLAEGVSREMARMVLPQNLYTEIYSQWDLHNLMHFFRLRLDPHHAQWEIRQYAEAMHQIFQELFPWTAEAYKKYTWEVKEVNG